MAIKENIHHWKHYKGNAECTHFRCGGCGKLVATYWAENHGGLLHGDYTLAGDVIFHDECWDRYIREYPP